MNEPTTPTTHLTHQDVVVLVGWMAKHDFTADQIALAVAKPWNHRDWISLAQQDTPPPDDGATAGDPGEVHPTTPPTHGRSSLAPQQIVDAIRRRGYPDQLSAGLAGGILGKWGLPLTTTEPVTLERVAARLADAGVTPYAAEHDLPRAPALTINK